MPSLFTSTIDSSPGSTLCHDATHCGNLANSDADDERVDVEFRQHAERRRREVQQEDEEQRPEHRLARLADRRRRVVAHQDVRQRGRADHQAEHQGEEIAARDVARGLVLARKRLGVAQRRPGARREPGVLGPGSLCGGGVLRIVRERLLGRGDLIGRRVVGLELVDLGGQLLLAGVIRAGQALQLGAGVVGARLEDGADLQLLRILDEFFLERRDLLELLAVHDLRDRDAGLLHRQPHHRDHVGDDQDDVLRHLRPGYRPHAAQERADQDAAQTQENAELERHAGQPRCDEADAVDLRDDVGERAQDRGEDADGARDIAAVACAEEVRNRELPELAQVRREEQRDQAIAAGPSHDECEAAEARQVQRAGHADERRRAHPVRAGGHAVEQRRNAPAGNVVLGRVGGAAHDADAGIQPDRRHQEDVADPLPREPHLLGDGEQDDERDESARVPRVHPLQLRLEVPVRACGEYAAARYCLFLNAGHYSSSPSCTSNSRSSEFMYLA